MNLSPEELSQTVFYEGKRCEICRNTGFKGRTGIFEFLHVDDDIRKEINNKSNADIIRSVSQKKGGITLRQDGWRKVKQGVTTIPEVLRVTLED
jgi:general secretion pathway protein E